MKKLQSNPDVYLLGAKPIFPDITSGDFDDLIAVGGDLSPVRLIEAYSKGIFPWYIEHGVIYWFSPKTRMIIHSKNIKISKSLQKTINKKHYEVRFDTDFENVIKNCAKVKRKHEDSTWITEPFVEGYKALNSIDVAKSVETYQDGKLVGGLYGLMMGDNFYGESMFFLKPDASKVALVYLAKMLYKKNSHSFIDCQIPSPHLKAMGGILISREEYLREYLLRQRGIS